MEVILRQKTKVLERDYVHLSSTAFFPSLGCVKYSRYIEYMTPVEKQYKGIKSHSKTKWQWSKKTNNCCNYEGWDLEKVKHCSTYSSSSATSHHMVICHFTAQAWNSKSSKSLVVSTLRYVYIPCFLISFLFLCCSLLGGAVSEKELRGAFKN